MISDARLLYHFLEKLFAYHWRWSFRDLPWHNHVVLHCFIPFLSGVNAWVCYLLLLLALLQAVRKYLSSWHTISPICKILLQGALCHLNGFLFSLSCGTGSDDDFRSWLWILNVQGTLSNRWVPLGNSGLALLIIHLKGLSQSFWTHLSMYHPWLCDLWHIMPNPFLSTQANNHPPTIFLTQTHLPWTSCRSPPQEQDAILYDSNSVFILFYISGSTS